MEHAAAFKDWIEREQDVPPALKIIREAIDLAPRKRPLGADDEDAATARRDARIADELDGLELDIHMLEIFAIARESAPAAGVRAPLAMPARHAEARRLAFGKIEERPGEGALSLDIDESAIIQTKARTYEVVDIDRRLSLARGENRRDARGVRAKSELIGQGFIAGGLAMRIDMLDLDLIGDAAVALKELIQIAIAWIAL